MSRRVQELRVVATDDQPPDEERRDAQGRRLCGAHRSSDGELCRAPAVRGMAVCRNHGAMATKAAKRAARDRLADEADPSIARLVHERDHAKSAADRIRAANSLLDRAGVSRRHAVDIGPQLSVREAKQTLLEKLLELRAAAIEGAPTNDARASSEPDVIDAEIVDDDDEERA